MRIFYMTTSLWRDPAALLVAVLRSSGLLLVCPCFFVLFFSCFSCAPVSVLTASSTQLTPSLMTLTRSPLSALATLGARFSSFRLPGDGPSRAGCPSPQWWLPLLHSQANDAAKKRVKANAAALASMRLFLAVANVRWLGAGSATFWCGGTPLLGRATCASFGSGQRFAGPATLVV